MELSSASHPTIEGFGSTPVVFPPLLQDYLGFNGGNDNNFGLDDGFPFNGNVPGFDDDELRTTDVASDSGLNDYSGSGEWQSMDMKRGVSMNFPVGRTC